jgi:hypothetical protein
LVRQSYTVFWNGNLGPRLWFEISKLQVEIILGQI